MGFNIKTTELLIQAKKLGVDFSKVATIGRQTLNGSFIEFENLFKSYGYKEEDLENIISRKNRYSEGFLNSLGAVSIDTFDASNYEGATRIWDMNLPIPQDLKENYSLLIDSGSLEHIFNFPQAIKNCMEMVKEGGHMIGVTPSNNFFGHGFYQFSPELFYRVFSKENGFELKTMWLFFPRSNSPIYEVIDPVDVKSRVSLSNSEETFLFYIAQRTEIKSIFSSFPQQSDYQNIMWNTNSFSPKDKKGMSQLLPNFLAKMGVRILRKLKFLKTISNPLGTANKNYFKRVEF
ncbi:hypothetical protein E4S40_01005 [Algoriphagus kandeliae]|uniref:Class I SAM-dependent methyltransferase n=1 Tax=Algoriphagus kandeliae TaxID=2562278 RepID=A0A4Y9R1P1_9BACT|nr:hypothetical protein [Algoriphagus kandeliae]TFV97266.1 hypothetical protein E4S40_01005 [Algoriphagus kandeliae]